MKQQRSGFSVMRRLIVLVRPLAPFMALAVLLGVAGFVCAIFLTILGGWAILEVLGLGAPLALGGLFACAAAFALLRGVLRYGEQACKANAAAAPWCWSHTGHPQWPLPTRYTPRRKGG